MKISGYGTILVGILFWGVLLVGCDQRPDEPTSDNGPLPRSFQDQRPAPLSSRASQDDSLYRQILETMQRENKILKQQIESTVEKCAQLETQLNEIKVERDVAFKAYIKVSESISSLKTDSSSKDKRIMELEQANEAQEQTIAQLNQQLDEILIELNNTRIGNTTNNLIDPNM
jgi:chromosome segregation ATPase